MQYLPYLLQFLQRVTKSQTVDPSVFSFSLKLAGLLAGKEHSFALLEVRMLKVALVYHFHLLTWSLYWAIRVDFECLKPLGSKHYWGPIVSPEFLQFFSFTA